MKRMFALGLAFVILCLGLATAAAEVINTTISTSLDIVVVIDQSNSMSGHNLSPSYQSSDPQNYRMEAANMVAAMADTNGSRVAVVTFAFQAQVAAGFDDFNIASGQGRKALMQKLESEVTTDKCGPGTDYGEALAVAYNLLAQRTDSQNKPMIILVTDGANDPSLAETSSAKPVYAWVGDHYAPAANQQREVSKDDADSLAVDVARRSKELGCAIYTIGLGDKDLDTRNLEQIAALSGGQYQAAALGESLPNFFAEMFSQRIGSFRLNAEVSYNEATKEYTAVLPVLNSSVLEANMYLDVQQIDEKSISLVDGNGRKCFDGENNTHCFTSKKFYLYKLVKPSVGMWTLTFKAKDPNDTGKLTDTIIFSMLYNYAIDLDFGDGLSQPAYNKTDVLELTTKFVDSTDRDIVTDDSNLYWTNDDYKREYGDKARDWFAIQVGYQLCADDGNGQWTPVEHSKAGSFTSDGNRSFSAKIDLGAIYQNEDGSNALVAKNNYALKISATGAGLNRTYYLPFSLVNRVPGENDISIPVWQVEDPDQIDNDDKARNISIDLPLRDADGETIVYRVLTEEDPAQAGFTIALEDGKLVGYLNEEDGRFLLDENGQAEKTYLLAAYDAAEGEDFTYRVTFTAHSRTRGDQHHANLEVVNLKDGRALATLEGGSITVPKQSTLEMTLTPVNSQDAVYSAMSYTVSNENGVVIRMEGLPTGETITLEAGMHGGSWQVEVIYLYNGMPCDSATFTYTVEEHAPVLAGLWPDFLASGNELRFNPMFLNRWIDRPTVDENGDVTYDLAALFHDEDNEPLSYEITEGLSTVSWQGERPSGTDQLVLTPLHAGKETLTIRATDQDGQSVEQMLTVTVVDLSAKWWTILLTALAIVVAIIILILIIHHIRKPRFFKGAQLQVFEGGSVSESETASLPRTKAQKKLSYYISADLLEKYGISVKALDNILLKPEHGERISVRAAKGLGSIEATLNGVALGKRWLTWNTSGTLTLTGDAESGDSLGVLLGSADDDNLYVQPQTDSMDADF